MNSLRDISRWTVAQQLGKWADATPDREFLQYETGEAWSYAETLRRVRQVAGGLTGLGVGTGSRVLIMMDNHLDIVLTWFASNYLGAVEVPLNTALRGDFLVHAVNQCRAEVLVLDGKYVEQLVEVQDSLPWLRHVVVRGHSPVEAKLRFEQSSFAALTSAAPVDGPADVTCRDIAAVMYTSGTSGPAKGVLVPGAHMMTFGAQLAERLSLGADDVFMINLPLFHGNAQFVQLLSVLLTGGKAVIYPRFSGSRWVSQLRESGATTTSLLGVMAQFIYDQPPTEHDADHQCRRIISIPMPADIAADFNRRFGLDHIRGYGMTEITVPVATALGEEAPAGSSGRPVDPWFDVRVVDPDTDNPVPVGEVGEIVIRPQQPWAFMQGYEGMADQTTEAWRNLWFHTGDAGRFDEDGNLYFVDRIRDRIRRRGENLSSYEIESVLLKHPAVAEAAVIGVPASEGDDDVVAFVVRQPGEEVEARTLWEHCKAGMPYFAVPRYIAFIDELPKTSNGKVLKRELRKVGTSTGVDLGTIGLTRGRSTTPAADGARS